MVGPGTRKPLEASLVRVGQRRQPFKDVYAFLLRTRWAVVVGLAATFYLAVNALFAALYWAVPGSIANADGSYLDAFFFSVQTFGSIGYGYMYSQGAYANTLVVVEAFLSVFTIAMLTGIVFAKFARPHARVLFSKNACIETRDGMPTLTFRMANERGNDVVEASVRVSVLKSVRTREGKQMRRFYDLALTRSSSPVFLLSWQVFHPIDEDSPLYGLGPIALAEQDVRLTVALTGLDGTFAQTIHARHLYWAEDILFDHRFADVMEDLEDGIVQMDFRKFHDVVPEGRVGWRAPPR